jgi:hypothetical protein
MQGVSAMARTFEVETIYYNHQGGIRTKECDLFDSHQKAVNYMRNKLNNVHGLVKQGDVKDGLVKLVDERGMIKQVIKVGEL